MNELCGDRIQQYPKQLKDKIISAQNHYFYQPMNTFIIVSCLMVLALGWSISRSNTCQCSEFHQSYDCMAHQCDWNQKSSTCSQQTCSSLNVATCAQAASYCYWNTTACLDRPRPSNCSSLQYNTTTECELAPGCTWITGDSCIEWSCELYNSTSCPKTSLNCVISEGNCVTMTSCNQFEECQEDNRCYTSEGNCIPTTCSSLSEDSCSFVYDNLNGNFFWGGSAITPCYFNNDSCTNATVSDLNSPNLCLLNTNGYYHWSSTKPTDGSCIDCYGVLLSIYVAVILLLA